MKTFIKLILSGVFSLWQIQIIAQDGSIVKGRVTDQSGKPLTGVSVLIKGTKAGTFTNENGNFPPLLVFLLNWHPLTAVGVRAAGKAALASPTTSRVQAKKFAYYNA